MAKLRCEIAIHRGRRSIDTSSDAKGCSSSKLTLMRFQRTEGDTLRSGRGSLVRPSLPLYTVHRALIDSALRVRYLAPAVLISHNTPPQFYNDTPANGRHTFIIIARACISRIWLEEYKWTTSFSNFFTQQLFCVSSKFFFFESCSKLILPHALFMFIDET